MEDSKLIIKLKYVDIHSHWLRQEVQAGTVTLEYQESSKIVADGFTKELSRQKHETFVRQLNLVDITEKLKKIGSDNTPQI